MQEPQPRLRQVDRRQIIPEVLLDQLVGPDHPVRAVWDYVEALDLSALLSTIRAVAGVPGRNATDPKILLALWMWGLSQGIGTARALDALCREHHAYRWLCGGVSLNYHTLASFRSSNEAALEGFLTAHVSALLHQGLIELTCVAQDGLRTRASAGAGSFRREATLEQCQQQVREQIEALKRQEGEGPDAVSRRQQAAQQRHLRERQERLAQARQAAAELGARQAQRDQAHPKEAAARKNADRSPRGSTTDPEARRMKMADGGTRPGYNVQCATTVGSRIIVGVAVTNQGADGGQLDPMLQQVGTRYRRKPKQALVDGGFLSKRDVEEAHRQGIEVYAPLKNQKKDLAAGKNPYAAKKGDGPGMQALRERMGTAAAQELYKQRAATAEWVNAGMRQRGLYQLTVRGIGKVRSVVLLHALVHNLWQTLRLLQTAPPGWTWQEMLRAEAA